MIPNLTHISQKIKIQQEKKGILKTIKINIMEDIFEELHNEFILSDDFIKYLKEIDIYSEKDLVE